MKKRDQKMLLFGFHAVSAAIAAERRPVYAIYLSKKKLAGKSLSRAVAGIVHDAEKHNIPVTYLETPDFQALTAGASHQGVAAHVGPYPFVALEALIKSPSPAGNPPFYLIADGVVDPHNLGALTRTAVCAGVDGLILPKDNAASPTPAVSKVSAGAVEYIPISRVTNLTRAIGQLKENNIWIAGLDRTGEKTVYEYDLTGPIALVMGGEEKGIRRLVRDACDFIMAIPQTGVIESLNVSVAGGIAMYEVCRQRRVTI